MVEILFYLCLMSGLAWASWEIIDAGACRIRPAQSNIVGPQPIDRERQAKLDAELAARRAEWELHGRAAADERFWRSVALTVAKAEAEKAKAESEKAKAESEKKLERDKPVKSVPATPAAVPDVPPPKMSFVYLIA